MNILARPVRSSLGTKYVMALTGLVLTLFVLGHMAGNLLVFAGPEALNSYAHGLAADPPLLWTVRLGLLVTFVLHLVLGVRLTLQDREARPVRYVHQKPVRANAASRYMWLTGLMLLAFLLYHLAHFTAGAITTADRQLLPERSADGQSWYTFPKERRHYLDLVEIKAGGDKYYRANNNLTLGEARAQGKDARHDVYSMVVSGFRNPLVSLSYVVAMAFLALHLWHGGSSWFQSLGIDRPRWLTEWCGPVLAVVVFAGNCSMPLAILFGWLGG